MLLKLKHVITGAVDFEEYMKYIKQFGIILTVSFAGEMLSRLIPVPVPASIYGLLLMLLVLRLGILSTSSVKETSTFLIEIMPLMFIPAAVGLLTLWGVIKPLLLPYLIIIIISTAAVMIVAGHVTQLIIRHSEHTTQRDSK